MLLLAYSGCHGRFGRLPRAGPSEGGKQHTRGFSYRDCDVAVGLAPLRLAGADSRYRIPRGRDPILSTQTSSGGRGFPLGGDVEGIGNFQRGKLRSHGTIVFTSLLILCGGDLEEMIDFQRRKQRSQVPKRFSN